ncbi:MAG: hypothetical protein EOP32_14990 [Rhodococcus sp. (in: high G+C Gram-positive bacteria)]|nr:MAG: hypothetical protein EOP32_14990 [Rhodococcus sp. (in: high G+C Gram-positive bacteria)]
MAVFAISYLYTDDPGGRDRHRPDHKDYISGLADQGVVLMSGPLGPTEQPGALIVVQADSKSAALALTEQDPFRIAGLVAEVFATEWVPMLGRLAKEI